MRAKRPNPVVWWAVGLVGTLAIAGVVALVASGLSGGGGTDIDTGTVATSSSDKAPASTPSGSAGKSAAVGSWRCMSYAGNFCPVGWDLTIKANGTYEMGAEKGTWKMVDATHIKMEGGFLGKWSEGKFATVSGGPHVMFTMAIDGVEMPVDYAKVD